MAIYGVYKVLKKNYFLSILRTLITLLCILLSPSNQALSTQSQYLFNSFENSLEKF